MSRRRRALVIESFDKPAAVLAHHQQTGAIDSRDLKTCTAARGQAVPPADVEGPGSGPTGDRHRWLLPDTQPTRGCGEDAPAGNHHGVATDVGNRGRLC